MTAEAHAPILSLRIRLLLAVLLGNLFVGAMSALFLWQSHSRYHQQAATNAANLAHGISRHVQDLLDRADFSLLDMVQEVGRQIDQNRLDPLAIHRSLREHETRQPKLEGIRIALRDGQVIFGANTSAIKSLNVADRDYFIAQRDNDRRGLFVSAPHVSRISGHWTLFFSRRINGRDGSFQGVAYGVLRLSDVAEFFSKFDVGKAGGISLRSEDMAIIVRHPDPNNAFRGNKTLSPELRQRMERGEQAGTYYSGTTWDGTARMVSFQKTGIYPLYVNVGVASEDYLTAWWSELWMVCGLCAVFTAASLGWSVHFYRLWQRNGQREAHIQDSLRQQVAEQTASLREYAHALEHSNAELEKFAYVVSHDLREPLRMVTSYLTLIKRRYQDRLDVDGLEFLGFAHDGAQRMDRMVLDLLDYARLGRQERVFVPVRLLSTIRQAVEHLGPVIREKQAQVTLDVSLEGAQVPGDEGQLLRLMQNLLSNGLKYHYPDAPPVLTVRAERTEHHWLIQVTDQGIGIAPEDQSKIFGLFQRLHGRDSYEGTGIGLASCRKIAEMHGGDIRVTSAPGQGSTFTVLLPHVNPDH